MLYTYVKRMEETNLVLLILNSFQNKQAAYKSIITLVLIKKLLSLIKILSVQKVIVLFLLKMRLQLVFKISIIV